MKVIPLRELERRIDARKKELGIVGNDFVPINSGKRRTPEKRALLQRLDDLAAEKGVFAKFRAKY